VPVDRVQQWEEDFLHFMSDQKSEIRDELTQKNDLDDDLIEKIKVAILEFESQFFSQHKQKEEPVAATV
jgi:F-type H+-transporting ATPase subunit alpha